MIQKLCSGGRVAFISTIECPWGGSEELWFQTALILAGAGTRVNVALRQGTTLLKSRELEKVATVWRLPPFRRPQRIFGRQKFAFLGQCSPDLIVISLAAHHHGADWAEECERRKLPYVLLVQAADESFFHTDENVARLSRAYLKAAVVYFVSRANHQYVERQLAVRLPTTRVVRNPFKVDYNATPKWADVSRGLYLACVGRLEPLAKGQDLLLEVLASPKWKARELHVAFYGQGLTEGTLRALAQIRNLKNVSFEGYCAEVEEIWGRCHGLVLPSRFEGLPLALVEAMLCSRIAVVTDVGGNGEFVQDEVNGFVAAAPKIECIDEALERAWTRRDEWKCLGAAARTRARELVPSEPAKDFAMLLEELLLNVKK